MCVDCGAEAPAYTPGWKPALVGVTGSGREAMRLAFYCPACSDNQERSAGEAEDERK